MSKRGLGKGLDALLSTSSMAREKQQVATQSQTMSSDGELAEISITHLRPGVYQPRKDVSPETLEELSASIQAQGIIQPIVVRPIDNGNYEIIAGERRWRAARHAGLKQVPCLVKHVEDRAAIAMALIENIQREDLNAIEEAQALERLQDEFKLTHQQVADAIGKSRTTVTNLLRLNQLDEVVKSLVAEKKIEMGHARALLMLEGEAQAEIASQVAKKQLTVRQTEQLVKKTLSPKPEIQKPIVTNQALNLSDRLGEMLQAKVSVNLSDKGQGKITISVADSQALEEILQSLTAKLES
ncbi:ParB/RepB/Spo0J family partition protein [Vibrio gazogenes]|uniref:Probable chromosome-partitioning protein ParB n=1 Tax=Vibrio gazogenes DSM 21264 = NBRC 103151 TaxID=1123492 RepID=A0A1M5GSD4_VIBGA|nr:ParB/RepB/Spo0J family partition protein [Vibrio gazogenes]USP13760.1 ParB/RepB/Spo0J family partition protein [Vibrio gazogenes]SHG06639.1 chromosome partitioning protein, ParB family [Vibrio gazogenes DSM 21264] [Vibrio gazogenes DSM 21264 = NBRC 103151]SJN58973.1 putative chromosome-partitioning protein ParB [Vibrio gazogenes]